MRWKYFEINFSPPGCYDFFISSSLSGFVKFVSLRFYIGWLGTVAWGALSAHLSHISHSCPRSFYLTIIYLQQYILYS